VASNYLVPIGTQRTETTVANSRFIATVGKVESIEHTKAFLSQIRAEMPDASHHVYAYRVGYGNSTIEGMSDDGEPTGTSGPPVLSVVRGSKVGDVIIVVTRYFGGTKLGTGGLVRAYTEAAHIAFNNLQTEEKIEKVLLGIEIPYSFYEQIKRMVAAHYGKIQEETFEASITILGEFPKVDVEAFSEELRDLTAGRVTPVILS
jgi:uncharacterized YigZ family protein